MFVHFDGKRPVDMAPARYAVRHMVAREVSPVSYVCIHSSNTVVQMEAELIRRTEGELVSTTAKDIIAAYNT